jgi:carbamoyltransferase
MGKYILGCKLTGHDTNAALVDDQGRLLACVEQERLDRIKHSSSFPQEAIDAVLRQAGARPQEVALIALTFCHDLFLKRIAHMADYFRKKKQFDHEHEKSLKRYEYNYALSYLLAAMYLKEKFPQAKVLDVRHHLTHQAAAYYCSDFAEAAILTVDANGELETATWGVGRNGRIEELGSIPFPHSLGFVYEYVSEWLGLGRLEGPGKTMGLASYGTPRFEKIFRERLLHILEEPAGWRIAPGFVNDSPPPLLDINILTELFGRDGRMSNTEVFDQFQADVAASVQKITEDAVVALARRVQKETGLKNLCLSGGVALNCVANGEILRRAGFERIFIQPASNDGGCGLGAALYAYHHVMSSPGRGRRHAFHPYLGPSYHPERVEEALRRAGLPLRKLEDKAAWTAEMLAQGKLVAWLQGGSEVGPRALGNRSIFADPRFARSKDELNARVKHREWWRPFAPIVLWERLGEYFEIAHESPYMLLVGKVRGDALPAITHVDHTARIQTLQREQNPLVYEMISAFGRLTGIPVVLNTSFNIRGEPLIDTPEQALNCLYRGGLDAVVIEDYAVVKEDLDPKRHKPVGGLPPNEEAYASWRKSIMPELTRQARSLGEVMEGSGVRSRILAIIRLQEGLPVKGFRGPTDEFILTSREDGAIL